MWAEKRLSRPGNGSEDFPAVQGRVLHPVQGRVLHRNSVVLYKNPQCSCCEGYADYLRQNGFKVEVKPTHDLAEISRKAGVPPKLQGCHTSFIDGYVVDGHVPVD